MVASYLQFPKKILKDRVGEALSYLFHCELCPRRCGVNRYETWGFCQTGRLAKVSSFNAHYGEEPPLSGFRGSGTIFFAHCNLSCIYCQNYPISQFGNGREITASKLAGMMLTLQSWGCHNVNFVTPSHVVPQIIEALDLAVEQGFQLPLVYNSSGYDSLNALRLLDGLINIYLPDLRYSNDQVAEEFSGAKNYVETSRTAVKEMHRQVGELQLGVDGVAIRGLIVRHLILPENLAGTRKTMKFIAQEISPHTYISLMAQYFPAYKALDNPTIGRRITWKEYEQAKKEMFEAGLHNGWFQGA